MRPTLKTRLAWQGARGKAALHAAHRLVRTGVSPSLLIVGAQKAGTTSLYNYLAGLPGFWGAQRKEVRFFSDDGRFAKGVRWYERFFDGSQSGVHFEATPEYLYHPGVPGRIRRYYPDARIVILLREPVARAYSAWNMYRHWATSGFVPLVLWQRRDSSPLFKLFFTGRPPTFREYVEHEMALMESDPGVLEPGILRRGIYADQIARYYDAFGPGQVLVIGFRDLVNRPGETVERVAAFAQSGSLAGLEGAGWSTVHNTGEYPSECPADVARELTEFYAPHNERLGRMLGGELAW